MSSIVEAPVRDVSRPADEPVARRPHHWLWLAAGLLGSFLVPFLFADQLAVPRDAYYAIYVVAVLTFTGVWLHGTHQDVRAVLVRNWRWGLGLGLAAVAATAGLVLLSGGTTRPGGWTLFGALLWRGVVYGAVDGLLLSVIPILGVFAAFGDRPLRRRSRRAVAGIGALALAMSLAFTAAYHLGYPDFRGSKVSKPVTGDVVWSLPTLVTLSPLGAPIAHAGMHVTAVLHSYNTDLFLPPHR